jgi:hypothetical protein
MCSLDKRVILFCCCCFVCLRLCQSDYCFGWLIFASPHDVCVCARARACACLFLVTVG